MAVCPLHVVCPRPRSEAETVRLAGLPVKGFGAEQIISDSSIFIFVHHIHLSLTFSSFCVLCVWDPSPRVSAPARIPAAVRNPSSGASGPAFVTAAGCAAASNRQPSREEAGVRPANAGQRALSQPEPGGPELCGAWERSGVGHGPRDHTGLVSEQALAAGLV